MAGLKWTQPPDKVWVQGAEAYVLAVRRAVHGVCQRWAPEIENWMKTGAVWTDRSSNARQSLYSQVQPLTPAEVVDTIELIISHGMIYGSFLEGYDYRHNFAPTRQGKKYAIVEPALDYFAPKVWADVMKLFT